MTQEPKLWKDMTPEEKGALLLAHHEGKVIQSFWAFFPREWYEDDPTWFDGFAYRIKPEPKRETRHVYFYRSDGDYSLTLIGTIDLIDGKPDSSSIKIEGV